MRALAAGKWHRAWRLGFLVSIAIFFAVLQFNTHLNTAWFYNADWFSNLRDGFRLWTGRTGVGLAALVPVTTNGYLIAMWRDPIVNDERAARWFRAIATPIIVLLDLFIIGLMAVAVLFSSC